MPRDGLILKDREVRWLLQDLGLAEFIGQLAQQYFGLQHFVHRVFGFFAGHVQALEQRIKPKAMHTRFGYSASASV